MLLVDIHELDIIFAYPVLVGRLEHNVDNIRCVFRLYAKDIFVLCCAENLGQGTKVDTESDVTVAAVILERCALQRQ